MAHSRSILANKRARNAIVGAENILIPDILETHHGDAHVRRVISITIDDNR